MGPAQQGALTPKKAQGPEGNRSDRSGWLATAPRVSLTQGFAQQTWAWWGPGLAFGLGQAAREPWGQGGGWPPAPRAGPPAWAVATLAFAGRASPSSGITLIALDNEEPGSTPGPNREGTSCGVAVEEAVVGRDGTTSDVKQT